MAEAAEDFSGVDPKIFDANEQVFHFLSGRVKMPLDDLMSHVHASADDIVIVCGTLIEGIGNWTSDLDVYVFVEERTSDFPAQLHHRHYLTKGAVSGTFDFMEGYPFTVDVYYREIGELKALVDKIKAGYATRLKRTKILSSSLRTHDAKLAYRLFDNIVLRNPEKFRSYMEGIARSEYCYTLYREVTCSFPEFRDIVGSWQDEDYETCCFQVKAYLHKQMRGFNHLNGSLNIGSKWVRKIATQLPQKYQHIANAYCDLNDQATKSTTQRKDTIIGCLDLADEIYASSRNLLDVNPAYLSCDDAREITRCERESYSVWHDELDREFTYRSRLFDAGLPAMRQLLERRDTGRPMRSMCSAVAK